MALGNSAEGVDEFGNGSRGNCPRTNRGSPTGPKFDGDPEGRSQSSQSTFDVGILESRGPLSFDEEKLRCSARSSIYPYLVAGVGDITIPGEWPAGMEGWVVDLALHPSKRDAARQLATAEATTRDRFVWITKKLLSVQTLTIAGASAAKRDSCPRGQLVEVCR